MRTIGRSLVLAAVAASFATIVLPGAVSAECTGMDTWPSFRAAARSADEIVVGRVTHGYDEDSAGNFVTFAFHVDETLRGPSRKVLDFREVVRSGLPVKVCRDSVLRVRVGDRLVFAFAAHYAGVPNPVTAIAFLSRPANRFLMPGMERLSPDEVRFVSGLPQTDTDTAAPSRTTQSPWIPILFGLAAGLLSLRMGRPQRYPEGRWPSSSRPSATNAVSGTRV